MNPEPLGTRPIGTGRLRRKPLLVSGLTPQRCEQIRVT
jgi:hypothetical protein